MTDAKPYPKVVQLASARKRYRRKVASRATWERLRDEKGDACRICGQTDPALFELHHLVHRDDLGDDVADNLVPLCGDCHRGVHLREPAHCRLLLTRLTDAEYSYMVERGGESYPERVYGIEYGDDTA
jgi:5-methylcytosine-specific restriction endonuclease McrA